MTHHFFQAAAELIKERKTSASNSVNFLVLHVLKVDRLCPRLPLLCRRKDSKKKTNRKLKRKVQKGTTNPGKSEFGATWMISRDFKASVSTHPKKRSDIMILSSSSFLVTFCEKKVFSFF